MKILYVYNGCSTEKYEKLFKNKSIMISQQSQKYHSVLLQGLRKNKIDIECISGLPVNRKLTKNWRIPSETEVIDGIKYHYFSTINFSAFRRIQLLIKSFFYTVSKPSDSILICDVLDVSSCIGALIAARVRRMKSVGIVTDVPGHLANSSEKKSLLEKIRIGLLNKFDGYVLLTHAMNAVVNTKSKPFVVLEGHVDEQMQYSKNRLEEKQMPKILMYAGSLKKIYGIGNLTEAFITANIPGWELHIYGDGDFREELVEICKKHSTVKYQGIRLNRDIVAAELKASLLVNPRPTNEDYVKYSFPSKNMEYMASGTPVITTHLPGMPDEYLPYVFLFEDETVSGMINMLQKILLLSNEELYTMGFRAKKFVLENKNSVVQARRILDMIRKELLLERVKKSQNEE